MIEIYADGSCFDLGSNQEGNIAIGIVAICDSKIIRRITKYMGKGTSLDSEYISIIEAIRVLDDYHDDIKFIYSDNKSIVDLISKYKNDRITIDAIQCLQPSNSNLLSVMRLLKTKRNIEVKWIDRAHNLAHDQARYAIRGLYEDTKSSILCSNLADGQISNIQSLFKKEEIFKLRIHRIHSTLIQ